MNKRFLLLLIASATTLHAGYFIKRNIRLVGEIAYDFTDPKMTYGKGSVGIVAAF